MSKASSIEGGPGWLNVKVVTTQIPPDALYLTPVRNAVDNKSIKLYANTTDQLALLSSTNITRPADPFLIADDVGYNDGNFLLS